MDAVLRAEVAAMIEARVCGAYSAAQAIRGGFLNNDTTNNDNSSGAATGANAYLFYTALVTKKASGRFLVGVSGNAAAGLVEAAGITMLLTATTPTVGTTALAQANGTAVGANGTIYSAESGGTAITVTATGGQTTGTLCSENNLNGLASSSLVTGFSMMAYYNLNVAKSNVAFSLEGTLATTTLTLTEVSFWYFEFPS